MDKRETPFDANREIAADGCWGGKCRSTLILAKREDNMGLNELEEPEKVNACEHRFQKSVTHAKEFSKSSVGGSSWRS